MNKVNHIFFERSREEYIIKVAQKLFARFGFFKATVNEIAKAAHMGKSSLYHYFRSKEDIFKKVIERENTILNRKIEEALEKARTPQEKLKAFVVTRMKYLNELANIYSALQDDYLEHYSFIEKTRRKNLQEEVDTVEAILREGVRKGVFFIKDLKFTSFAIVSALKGLEYPWFTKMEGYKLERNLDKLIEVLFNGIVKR